MTTSARENIMLYLVARLGTVTGVTVYRSREAPVDRSEGVVIILRPIEEKIVKYWNEGAIRDMTVGITAVVRAAVPDAVADATLQQVQTAIMSDTTLTGLAARCIELDTRWNFEVADQTALAAEVRYVIRYLTPVGSFSTLA